MGKYADSPDWADIAPIVQEESAVAPLAQIAYSEDYSEAMSYLRAVMAADEKSARVLELTETIIRMNPSHYTVWLYRAATLAALNADLSHELTAFLNPLSLTHLKNYQIWHHRQTLLDRLGALPADDAEHLFLQSMFARDAKNYHVWSYRQWLVRRFALWDDVREWDAVRALLAEDVRNNSAWNHRWYLAFARPGNDAAEDGEGKQQGAALQDTEIVARELAFAMAQVELAPQNPSPWNYIRGLWRQASGDAAVSRAALVAFARRFAGGADGAPVRSSHALELLALLYAPGDASGTGEAGVQDQGGEQEEAVKLLQMLADTYDPIRAPYWRYRIALVNGSRPAAVAAA